jgi:TonB-linked SusC/RagA family outer membrane protein
MKTLVGIMVLSLFASFPSLNAQPLSIHIDNGNVKEVCKQIRKQTGIGFSLNGDLLKHAKKITLHLEKANLDLVLDTISYGQAFIAVYQNSLISLQEREPNTPPVESKLKLINIWVKVINQRNIPMENIFATNPESGQTTNTNSHGVFYMSDVLPFSFLILSGDKIKTDTFRIPNKTYFTLTVKTDTIQHDADELAVVEVVSNGYQQSNKKTATGSYYSVSQDVLQLSVNPSLEEKLIGMIPGYLQTTNYIPGTYQSTPMSLSVRTTMVSNPRPLIIVDNFPFEGNLNDINPEDVENITVLRDAAAASIWGARAANGVIVITTKSGKFNQKPSVSVNSSLSIGNEPDLYKLDGLSARDKVSLDSFLYKKNYYLTLLRTPSHPALSPVVEAFYNTGLNDVTREQYLDSLRNLDVRKDMQKYYYRKSKRSQFNLQLNGGGKYVAYGLSLGFDHTQPEIKESWEERKTVLWNNNFRPYSWMELTTTASYSRYMHRNTNGIPVNTEPYAMLADADGNPVAHAYQRRLSYINSNATSGLLDWNYFPLRDFQLRRLTLTEEDLRVQAALKIRRFPHFLEGLDAGAYVQYQEENNEQSDLKNKESFEVRNLVNNYTQKTTAGITRPIPWGDILDVINNKQKTFNIRYQLNYNKSWRNNIRLNLMAGRDRIRLLNASTSNRTYDYSYYNQSGQTVPLNQPFPIFYFPSQTLVIPNLKNAQSTTLNYISYYGNGNLQLMNRYFFSVSGRMDISNLYGAQTNDKKIPLYALGLSWDLSGEKFYRIKWLPDLKLRFTYGIAGNTPNSPNAYLTASQAGQNTSLDPMSAINNLPIPSLRWEKTKTLNIGMQSSLVNDVMDVSIDWFSKKATDLMGFKRADETTGSRSLTGNVSAMKGQHLDVVLSTKIIRRAFQWRSDLLVTWLKDYVVTTDDTLHEAWEYCDPTRFTPVKNKPLYGIFSFPYEGVDVNGNPLGRNKDTFYTSMLTASGYDSLIYHGRSTPPVFGTLINQFSWKQFTLSTTILYKLNYYFRRQSINYSGLLDGSSPGSADFSLRYKPGLATNTNIPSMQYPFNKNRDLFYNFSQTLIERADHIRLQNIQLGFDLEKKALQKLQLKTCTIYVNLSNLGIIWKANDRGIDPDKLTEYPQPLMLSVGIRGTFK